jgi:hypothetical protein
MARRQESFSAGKIPPHVRHIGSKAKPAQDAPFSGITVLIVQPEALEVEWLTLMIVVI